MTGVQLDSGRLERAAARSAGRALRQTPGGAEAWLQLLDAIAREAQLSARGEAWARSTLFRELLRADFVARLPDVDQIPTPTVVVTGLARSGTTALHRLVVRAFDTGFLRADDAYSSGLVESVRGRPSARSPASGLHRFDIDAAEECDGLFLPTFRAAVYAGYFHVPSYADWLERAGMADAYPLYARSIQLAQGRMVPTRWAVKSPTHLGFLDHVRAVYPNSTVLWVLRPARETIGSIVDLAARFRAATCRRPWAASDTMAVLTSALRTVDKALATGVALPSGSLVCVDSRAVRTAPASVVGQVASACGWTPVADYHLGLEPTADRGDLNLSRSGAELVRELDDRLARALSLFGQY